MFNPTEWYRGYTEKAQLLVSTPDKVRSSVILLTCITLAFALCLIKGCVVTPAPATEIEYSNEQIANAINKAENSVKYPYGIKSINTYGNKEYARKICLSTIRNNRKRFVKQTEYRDFISFLGSRFCPTTIVSEYSLNKNWVKNVNFYLARTR